MLAAILLASVVLLVTTTVGEARSAPSWLSRLVRAVIGRSEERVAATASDTIVVFGPRQYERARGAPVTVTEHFTLPAGAKSPAYLCVRNGEPDGTRRNSASTVTLNGVQVVGQSNLNQQVAGLHRQRGGWHDHALAHQDWRTSQSAERWRIAAR